MASLRAVRGVVRGRVQGVAYRASLRHEAIQRGLVGWVRNQLDGSVEFFLQGEPASLEEVLAWARSGPPLARVTGVDVSEATYDPALTRVEIR
jgi:acylphosphatase